MRAPASGRRGVTLLFVVGILSLLAVLALALSAVLQVERAASAHVLERSRAELTARAGVERAIHLLTETELADPRAGFADPWTYRSQDGSTWGLDQPLREARNPSFHEGRTASGVVHSGRVSGAFGDDVFVLRVADCNGRLALNGSGPALARMLDALGRAIEDFDRRRRSAGDPLFDAGYAARVAAEGRPPRDPVRGRGAEVAALRDRLGDLPDVDALEPVLGSEDVDLLRPYVTAHAWRDPSRDLRAPLCVNTAPWPVLVAAWEGLQGELPAQRLSAGTARDLATRVDRRRREPGAGPLTGPGDLERLVSASPLSPTERALVLRGADPDLADRSRNPGRPVLEAMGELGELRRETVPLGYVTYGRFEVTSLGRVLARDGRVLAEARAAVVVSVYDLLHLNTQEDLEVARRDDDRYEIESHPHPVSRLGGPERRNGEPVAGDYNIPETGKRRRLRYVLARGDTGYLEPAQPSPGAPSPRSDLPWREVSTFTFDADFLESADPALAEAIGAGAPAPGGLRDQIAYYGFNVGVHPEDLGLPGEPLPQPVDVAFGNDYNPDGLLLRSSRDTDMRYGVGEFPDEAPEAGPRTISGSSVTSMWFKLRGSSLEWTPLFAAHFRPDEEIWPGTERETDEVRVEVEARLTLTDALLVRSRVRVERGRDPETSRPPPPLPFTTHVEREVVFTDLAGGEWHHLVLPIGRADHQVFVDGRRGAPTSSEPWPTSPGDGSDVVVPGGFAAAGSGRPEMSEGTVDDLVVATFEDPEAGRLELQAARRASEPVYARPQRYVRPTRDHMGSFRGELPPVLGETPRLGALVWTEHLPPEWDGATRTGLVFLVQASYAYGSDAVRRQISPRPEAAPDPRRLASPYVRAWWSRVLQARIADLTRRLSHARDLRTLAEEADDAASAATFGEAVAVLRRRLRRDRRRRDSLGDVAPPSDSVARQRPAVQLGDPERVGLQLDFVVCDQLLADPLPAGSAAPCVGEVILPYQTRPRVLDERWE